MQLFIAILTISKGVIRKYSITAIKYGCQIYITVIKYGCQIYNFVRRMDSSIPCFTSNHKRFYLFVAELTK